MSPFRNVRIFGYRILFFRYEFSHIKTPRQQLVFNKQEVHPTPISLPTPPASPEFYGTSLQKWYQKKPLFTLTAKGQVKRLEKYLQIQKTLEMCKREHEFQVHTQNMKKAYTDFEFREHQPLLYEDKDVCCVCPCNSSKNYDIDFIPVDYRTCSPAQQKLCVCSDEEDYQMCYQPQYYCDCSNEEDEEDTHKTEVVHPAHHMAGTPYNSGQSEVSIARNISDSQPDSSVYPSDKLVDEEKIIPTKIVKEGEADGDDRGIFKVVVKNKQRMPTEKAKYFMKLFDNKNYNPDDNEDYMIEKPNTIQIPNSRNCCSSGGAVSRITLDNVAKLPFDRMDEKYARISKSGCYLKKTGRGSGARYILCSPGTLNSSNSGKKNRAKYDYNKNEIF